MNKNEKLAWFNNARFGMFIHWGLYSLLGKGEWAWFKEGMTPREYSGLANSFNPEYFDANEWARIAKEAGMRYMVLTAKHHDGFCLFDSAYTNYTSVKTAAKRDFVKEFVDACRNEGLGVGLYITVRDWSYPESFEGPIRNPAGWKRLVEYFHKQVTELMTHYGKINILWYDGCEESNLQDSYENGKTNAENWRAYELNKKVRELQPDILINGRLGIEEDFGTPEQNFMSTADKTKMNESCVTMNDTWGYNPDDNNWKSTAAIIGMLIHSAAIGNNLLLNVGPDGDGLIPYESVSRLREIGSWLRMHGEAIYGTKPQLHEWWDCMSPGGRIITKGNCAYIALNKWDIRNGFVITSLKNSVKEATVLATGDKLNVERSGRKLIFSDLPHYPPSYYTNIIKLELDGIPETQFFSGKDTDFLKGYVAL